jgi:hypothetical protein
MRSFEDANPKPGFARAHLVTSALLLVLVLTQAAIAGQELFPYGDFSLHGYLGNASFTLGFVAAVLAAFGRVPGFLLGLSGITLLCLFAQTGLGYVGREEAFAASLHIPLGVTIFGLVTLQTGASALLTLRPTEPARTSST